MHLPAPYDERLPRLITLDQLDALLPDEEPVPEPGDFGFSDSPPEDVDPWSDAA